MFKKWAKKNNKSKIEELRRNKKFGTNNTKNWKDSIRTNEKRQSTRIREDNNWNYIRSRNDKRAKQFIHHMVGESRLPWEME